MKTSKGLRITSYLLQGLVGLMFLSGAIMNLIELEMSVEQATMLGYPENAVAHLGQILLIFTILYLVPKTNVLGAALLTAWLGGAVATHMIHQDPFVNSLAPVIFGIIVWVALWLRSENLRKVFPLS